MQEKKHRFRMITAVLTVICVVFVAEAAAPVAAIGNSQYFWWLFMMLCFLVPYGLIASELGTAYDNGGGLYDWVTTALGHRWGARVSWYYWINFPLWMASLAVIFPDMLSLIIGRELSAGAALLTELAFIWIVTAIAYTNTSDAPWILNGAAVIKVLLAVGIGAFGIYGAAKNGMANPITVQNLLPSFRPESLAFISVIIFNMLGFEVICTMSEEMENPKKQIPQAIIIGGIVIAAIYMFSAFGIGTAIPTSEISTESGLIDAFMLLTNRTGGIFIGIVALLFLLTLFGNMISWSTGVHEVAAYAADSGDMPAVFGKRNRAGRPSGGVTVTALLASAIVIAATFISDQGLFWSFFALNLVMLLLAYVPMFPSFLKLRREDPSHNRPFVVPGGKVLLWLMTYVPMALLMISIFFTAVPLSFDADTLASTLPIFIGAVIFVILGEVMLYVKRVAKKRNE